MIRIDNPKILKMITEILSRTSFSNPQEYLEFRIKQDHEQTRKGKKVR